MRIKWLRLALKDMDEIAEYISKDNERTARTLVKKIWDHTQILKSHPEIGRPGRVPKTKELVITNTSYIIPYRVINENVEILRVMHSSRKWPRKF